MKTYDDVAAYFDVAICTSSAFCGVSDKQHVSGYAYNNRIHWAPRRLTRPGLRRFLTLVAQLRLLHYERMNRAMRIYSVNAWVSRIAPGLHVRFPNSYSSSDRAKVRWLESRGMPISAPARRWAHRQETP